jgi:hypothetical protein
MRKPSREVSIAEFMRPLTLVWVVSFVGFLLFAGCTGQSPLQEISSKMDILKDNMISDALVADAKATMGDVESWKGKIPESDYLSAKSCAEYIIVAHDEKVAIIAEIQRLILSADSEFVGLSTGAQSPMIIRRMTAGKYAPQGMKGAAIKPQIEALEARGIKLVSGARNACFNLFDDQLLIKLGMKMFGGGL